MLFLEQIFIIRRGKVKKLFILTWSLIRFAFIERIRINILESIKFSILCLFAELTFFVYCVLGITTKCISYILGYSFL